MINKYYIFLIDRLHSQLNLLTKRLKVNLFRDFTTFSIKAMKLFSIFGFHSGLLIMKNNELIQFDTDIYLAGFDVF